MAKEGRVFVDSSVFIAAILSPHGGSFYILTNLKDTYSFQTNEYVLEEVARVLDIKFTEHKNLKNLFFLLLGTAEVEILSTPKSKDLVQLKKILNKEDTPILASAIANSDFLLTLDNDFFAKPCIDFSYKHGLVIVKPRDLLRNILAK